MRCLLTGHSRGLGRALHERLGRSEWQVRGISRATGLDIGREEDRKQIAKMSLDFDVFVNNAQSGFAQTHLLLEVHREWEERGKTGTILNIGSMAGVLLPQRNEPILYDYEKLSLLELSANLALRGRGIRVMCVNFGYLETPEILARTDVKDLPKLSLEKASDTIYWMLTQPQDCVISGLSMYAMRT